MSECTQSQTPPSTHLGEIHAERVHVQPVQEARKALAEARQAVVHDLHIAHVRLERRHRIRELRKRRLKGVQRERLVGGGLAVLRAAGRSAEGSGGAGIGARVGGFYIFCCGDGELDGGG